MTLLTVVMHIKINPVPCLRQRAVHVIGNMLIILAVKGYPLTMQQRLIPSPPPHSSRCTFIRDRAFFILIILIILLATESGSIAQSRRRPRLTCGINPLYSYLVMDNKSQPKGFGTSVAFNYFFNNWLSLRVSGQWSSHTIEVTGDHPQSIQHQVVNPSLGLGYLFDMVSWNPVIEAGIGLLHQRFEGQSTTDIGLYLGIGFDYWLRPWFAAGAAFHYHAFLSNPTQYPVYFDAGPRISFRFF